jgi:hypothetical protein
MVDLPFSPAAERNRQPILDQLLALLPPEGRALEIAAGSGQHAVAFAAALPGWTWQPTDHEADLCPLIDERVRRTGLGNVLPARQLDVLDADWPERGPWMTSPSTWSTAPTCCTSPLGLAAGR